MIELHTWPTPNGHKAQIMLEEIGLPYEVRSVDITQGAQLTATYLALNPNNKVPTIVDTDGPNGDRYVVFESGAILLYLADKTGKLLPSDRAGRHLVTQWLMWQMGGLGPMLGQAQHFFRYAAKPIPYAIERYTKESYRLLDVMELRLREVEYLAGEYSIADIACFPWIRIHKLAGLTLDRHPAIRRWYGAIRARPAVGRGLGILIERWKDVATSSEAKHHLFGGPQYSGRRGE